MHQIWFFGEVGLLAVSAVNQKAAVKKAVEEKNIIISANTPTPAKLSATVGVKYHYTGRVQRSLVPETNTLILRKIYIYCAMNI